MGTVRRLKREAIRLPVVEVDLAARVFRNPFTKRCLVGVRRQIVERAAQVLNEILRGQIDGQVELDVRDLRLVLQAAALTIEWQGDLLFFRFNDDE